MLKDMNKDGRTLKTDWYEGYDEYNNSAENGLYIYLTFNNEKYEICCYVNDEHILESVILINEKAQEQGVGFGECLYNFDINFNANYTNRELMNKTIRVLREEGYIPKTTEENYSISFEEAKQKPIYKFNLVYSLDELRKKIENKDFKDEKTVVAVLVFGNIDIELNIWNLENGDFFLEYYVCLKYANIGWSSFDPVDKKIELVDNLEEDMFNELIEFAKKYNLYWSTFND